MHEAEADLWDMPADARVITVNQCVKTDGTLVMGRGCAREASVRYPGLAQELGGMIRDALVRASPLKVYRPAPGLLAYVVKPAQHVPPDTYYPHPGWSCGHQTDSPWCRVEVLRHVLDGLPVLEHIVNVAGWRRVVLPRLGCGYGGLRWETVRPILAAVLDDRFTVVHLPNKEPAPR